MMINWENICSQYDVSITWNTFIFDTSKTIQENIDNLMLSDDLLQIILNQEENIIFDVGYPDFFNEHGFFEIYIIKDFDWDKPLAYYKTQDIFNVINILENSLDKYSKLTSF